MLTVEHSSVHLGSLVHFHARLVLVPALDQKPESENFIKY